MRASASATCLGWVKAESDLANRVDPFDEPGRFALEVNHVDGIVSLRLLEGNEDPLAEGRILGKRA